MTSNITLTQSGTIVNIGTTTISETSVNPLIIISIPSTDLIKITKVVNLLKIIRRWEIDGVLSNDIGSDTATTKRNNLRTMFRTRTKSAPITLTYDGVNYNVGMEKLDIKEIPTDQGDVGDNPRSYEVKMTLIEIDEV